MRRMKWVVHRHSHFMNTTGVDNGTQVTLFFRMTYVSQLSDFFTFCEHHFIEDALAMLWAHFDTLSPNKKVQW